MNLRQIDGRRMKLAAVMGITLFALGAMPAPSRAAEGSGADKAGSSASEKAMMDQMMALATPGEHHKQLGRLVGSWKTVNKMWMGPGEPVVSQGSSTYEWILGGRYLQSTHKGDVAGMPFEGMGIDGYDNAKGQCFSIWFDNMGTGYMVVSGPPSADGKKIVMTGTTFEPSLGKEVKVRNEINWTSDTEYVFSMYMEMPGPDGKSQDTKWMELTATKQ